MPKPPSPQPETWLREITETAPIACWAANAEGHFVLASPAMAELVGVAGDELLGDRWRAYIHPDDVESFAVDLVDHARTARWFHRKLRLQRADGALRWVEVSAFPIGRWVGSRIALVGICNDVTDRELTEAAFAGKDRFRFASDTLLGLFYELDVATGTVVGAPGFHELIGAGFGEVKPTIAAWRERIHPEDRAEAKRRLERAIEARTPTVDLEYRLQRADGSNFWVWDRARLERDASGRLRSIVGLVIGIDARRRVEANARLVSEVQQVLVQDPDPLSMLRRVLRELAKHVAAHNVLARFVVPDRADLRVEARLDGAADTRVIALDTLGLGAVAIDDVARDPRTAGDEARLASLAVRAFVTVPVEGAHRRTLALHVTSSTPRTWRPDELEVIHEIATRVLPALERAYAETLLKARERQLALAMAANNAGSWRVDLTTHEVDLDERVLDLLAVPSKQAAEIAREWLRRSQVTAATRPNGPALDLETSIVGSDGLERWFAVRGLMAVEDGRPQVLGMLQDVTDRKRAEQVLRDNERRFMTMADTAPAMLWITDREDRCVFLSRRWYDFTGQTVTEALGMGWSDVIHPEDRDHVVRTFLRAAGRRESFTTDFRLRAKVGAHRWMSVTGNPWKSDSGDYLGYIGSVSDVHERKLAEQALVEADRRKDEYLAVLGHELRNPLAAIRSATELLQLSETDDVRLRRAHAVLERQSGHMTQLIDGLLEVSRIARGKIQLTERVLDLREVLDQVLQDRSAEAMERGLRLVRELPPTPVWISGDHVRLVQIFDNLVGNALKFTSSPGTVTVSATAVEPHADIRIRDTGAGIRPELLERIFEPFQQDDQGAARTAGGLGLGLALAKGLVELHRGTIAASSAGVGRGAELRVLLPLTSSPHRARASTPPAIADVLRVLIVEDDPDVGEMLRDLLELKGHQAALVEDAPAALEHVRRERVDVVLCDIGLPGMNGYELAAAIRADPALRDLALYAISGYGQPEDRARSRAAGFDDHLTKPIDPRVLDDVLAHRRDRSTPSSRELRPS